MSDVVKAEPTLLVYEGRTLADTMTRERVTEAEIMAAVRATGAGSLDSVYAVVLETDGKFSVVPNQGEGARSTLKGVNKPTSQ